MVLLAFQVGALRDVVADPGSRDGVEDRQQRRVLERSVVVLERAPPPVAKVNIDCDQPMAVTLSGDYRFQTAVLELPATATRARPIALAAHGVPFPSVHST